MTTVFLSNPRSESFVSEELAMELTVRGIHVLRIEDVKFGSDLQASILSAIKRSDAVIAHAGFRDSNANVLLEIGYAVGAGTPVILVSDGPSEIPSEIASLPVFFSRKLGSHVYDEIVEYVKRLSPRKPRGEATFDNAREHLAAAAEDTALLEQISPQQFEELVAQSFVEMGFDAELLTGINDAGIDIRLKIPGADAVAVEVKKFTSQGRLGIGEVQRLVGACFVAGARCAILLTTGGFTRSAFEFAENAPMSLHLITLDEFLSETRDSITKRCT
ncbi:restriction endonuclease [Thalassoglobus sp.]|uniref:restriction endonuclease n=1 Tax=Thalassoglobus sp. TaxID=2795869 RepID=UPI003AA7BA9F